MDTLSARDDVNWAEDGVKLPRQDVMIRIPVTGCRREPDFANRAYDFIGDIDGSRNVRQARSDASLVDARLQNGPVVVNPRQPSISVLHAGRDGRGIGLARSRIEGAAHVDSDVVSVGIVA